MIVVVDLTVDSESDEFFNDLAVGDHRVTMECDWFTNDHIMPAYRFGTSYAARHVYVLGTRHDGVTINRFRPLA